jgi:DNA-entry nuclease
MRFHAPSCSGVATMNEANKAVFTGDREDLIAQGYSPCGQCQP